MRATIVPSRRGRAAAAMLAGFVVGMALLVFCGRAAAVDFVIPAQAAADGREQQLRGQLEPLLKVELSFANRVCQLNDDQRRALIAESKKWFDEFVADYAKKGGQMMGQGQVVFHGGLGRQPRMEDPRELIQGGLADVVQSILPEELVAVYEQEAQKRDEFQTSVAIENLVTRLDEKLLLSSDQRRALTESLTKEWDSDWVGQLEMFMHATNMWPDVPDHVVTPHLSEAQRTMWSRLRRQSRHMFFGVGWMHGQAVIDDIDLDEVEEAADEEAAQETP